jgi:hypothetical protein
MARDEINALIVSWEYAYRKLSKKRAEEQVGGLKLVYSKNN